jgi:hypothetical protein
MTTIVDVNAMDAIVTEAMRTDATWARYVEEVGAPEARAQLIRLRADVKLQRQINAALLASGELPRLEFQQWLGRSAGFDRALARRLASIQVNPGEPAGNRSPGEVRENLRRMHKANVRLIETLALAIHRYLEDDEDEEVGEDVLEEALDAPIDLGKLGVMPLRAAIEQGFVPGKQGVS